MANFTIIGPDASNPKTHTVIDVEVEGGTRRISVVNGSEEQAAQELESNILSLS